MPALTIQQVPVASDRDLEAARQAWIAGDREGGWRLLEPVLDKLDPEDASQWESGWVARIALESGHFEEAAPWVETLIPSWLSRFDRLWLAREEGTFDLAEAIDLSRDPQRKVQELFDRQKLAEWLWESKEAVEPEALLGLGQLSPQVVAAFDDSWPSAERLTRWAEALEQLATPEEAAVLAPLLLRRAVALGDRGAIGLLRGAWGRGERVATSEQYAMAQQAIADSSPANLVLQVPPRSQWEAAAIEARGMSRPGAAALEWGGQVRFPDRVVCAGATCQGAPADAVDLEQLEHAADQPWIAAARRLSSDHPGAGVVLMLPEGDDAESGEVLDSLLAELRQAHIPVEGWYRYPPAEQDPGKVVDDIPIAVPKFPDREVEDRFRTRHPLVEGAGVVLLAAHDVAKLLVPKFRFSSIELPVLGIGDWDKLSLDPSDRDAFEGVAFLLPGRDPQEAIDGAVAQVVRRAVMGALIDGWMPEEPGWKSWEVPGQGKIELSGNGVRLPYQIFRFKNLTPQPEGTLQIEEPERETP